MFLLTDQFHQDHLRRTESTERRRWFIRARQNKIRNDKVAEQNDDQLLDMAISALATDQDIETFKVKLDEYDEATVAALMKNREALEKVQGRLDATLARAYETKVGLRVFKTANGSGVFDEFGRAVPRDVVDPDLISPRHPTWEEYKPDFDRRIELEQQRERILKFQKRVDAARDEIADGPVTKSRLQELDAELADALPPSVKAEMKGSEASQTAAPLKSQFAGSAASLDVIRQVNPGIATPNM